MAIGVKLHLRAVGDSSTEVDPKTVRHDTWTGYVALSVGLLRFLEAKASGTRKQSPWIANFVSSLGCRQDSPQGATARLQSERLSLRMKTTEQCLWPGELCLVNLRNNSLGCSTTFDAFCRQ